VALGHAGQAQRGVVKIRPAGDRDIEAIHVVHMLAVKGLQETDPRADEQREGVDEWVAERRPSDIAEEMRNEHFVVMADDAEILGFGALHIPKSVITSVFVNPRHQRLGIGRALLAELEATAREAELKVVQLQATGTAIEFYLKTGYQSDPPVEPGADWARMKKDVS